MFIPVLLMEPGLIEDWIFFSANHLEKVRPSSDEKTTEVSRPVQVSEAPIPSREARSDQEEEYGCLKMCGKP